MSQQRTISVTNPSYAEHLRRSPMNPRYYFSRKPSQAEGGPYKIFDRVLDIRIASCDFKENAELICTTLNGFMKLEVEVINLRTALEAIKKGPPPSLENGEVASWAGGLAHTALSIS